MNTSSAIRRRLVAATLVVGMVAAACDDDSGSTSESLATSASPSSPEATTSDIGATTSTPATAGDTTRGASLPDTVADDGGWTYTDALGRTVELPERPTRIAGLNDVVAGLWRFGVQPAAAFGYTSMADDVQFDGLDIDSVDEVGSQYGEINLEALSAAEPDLIVTTIYDESADLLYGFKDAAQQERVEEIAPLVTIKMVGDGLDVLGQMEQLAAALGAELDSPTIQQAKAEFDAARQRLATAGERDIAILPLAAYEDSVFLAEADDDPALHMYKDAGADFVDLQTDEFFWEEVSWENIDKYDADLVLYSLRAMEPQAMRDVPTFTVLPANQADQVQPWKYVSMDYASQAAYMNELADWIEAADPVATG